MVSEKLQVIETPILRKALLQKLQGGFLFSINWEVGYEP